MRQSHDESDGGETREGMSANDGQNDNDAVPVCPRCLTPFSAFQHYCENCGETVGKLTPYIPYLNIPHNYGIFSRMWKRAFVEQGVPIASRVFYACIIVFFVPIMLVGLPFIIIEKLRRKPQTGLCRECGYNLTGDVSGICPKCGTPIGDEEDER